MLFPAHFKYIFLSILLVFGMFNFTRTTMDILSTSKRLQNMQDNVTSLETQKKALEKDLKYKKTSRFIEEEARNRLNMIRQGEKVLVLSALQNKPETFKGLGSQKDEKDQVLGVSDTANKQDAEQSNFWQWVELFL